MSIQIRVERHKRGCADAYINRYETTTGLFYAQIVWDGTDNEYESKNLYYGLEATGMSSDEAYIRIADKIKEKYEQVYGGII